MNMFLLSRRWIAALSTVFAFVACLRAATPAAAPTEEELAKFGAWIVERIEAGEIKQFTRLFDAQAFAQVATDGFGLAEKDQHEIALGLRSSFAESLERDLGAFESSRFLRVQTRKDEKRVLLRFIHANGALNYIAFICARRADGGLKWVDAFSYLTGEKFTESTRRLLLPVLAESKKSILEKLASSEGALVRNMPKLQQAIQLVREGKAEESYAIFSKLPPEVRKNRFILLGEMRATQQLSEELYLKTIQTLEEVTQNDASLDLALLDGHLLRKDYPGALKRLASFEKEIGGDAYLHFLRSNILVMAEDYPGANEAARKALKGDPSLSQCFDALLNISLKLRKFDDTAALLTELQTKHPQFDVAQNIRDEPAYADFRESKAGQAWLAQSPEKAAKKTDPTKQTP